MKILLINPPVNDPTCPYSSLYYLKSFIESNSKHAVMIKDSNIEWLNFLVENDYTEKFNIIVNEMIHKFESQAFLSSYDFIHYYKLLNPDMRVTNEQIKKAFRKLKERSSFYDVENYLDATEVLEKWIDLLSATSFPANFNNFNYDFGIFKSRSKICDLLKPISNMELGYFNDYLDKVLFPYIDSYKPSVIGISIPLKYQLYFSIYLAKMIRKNYPDIRLISGGTCLHQIYKQTHNNGNIDDLFELFDLFDFSIVGEGEEPLLKAINCLENNMSIDHVPNVIQAKNNQVTHLEKYYYHSIDKCPPPDYSDVEWQLYLSPEKFISYVPTRGCYWGKCSFCDYGLSSGRATSTWRCKSIEVAIDDIKKLSSKAKFIYFCVDAIHPNWLLKFSQKIIEENISFFWGAEIRLDKQYTEEEAILLKNAGCIAVSIGFESASSEIIRKINKGNMPFQNKNSISNFKKAGIAIYPMTFIGFPGEKYEDALKTLEFLECNFDNFALLPQPSTFYLEGSSDISENYQNYSISEKMKFKNLDIIDGWFWKSCTLRNGEYEKLSNKINEICCVNVFSMTRPLLSVDTPHSMMYIAKYGDSILKEIQEKIISREVEPHKRNKTKSPFNLNEIEHIIESIDSIAKNTYDNCIYPLNEFIITQLNNMDSIFNSGIYRLQDYDKKNCETLINWASSNYSRNRNNYGLEKFHDE